MNEKIDITNLTPEHHQALVCMYYAKMPSTDSRYKGQKECFNLFQKRFNRKYNAYKNIKDTFDYFFENGRQGWKNTPLKSRGQACVDVYEQYKDYDLDVLEVAVKEIIELYSIENISFISLKCGIPETVHRILDKESEIVIDGVYTLPERIVNGSIVFVTVGGDIGKSEVDWDPGFVGIARVIKEPYDHGYNDKPKYFKFNIQMVLVFSETYKRKDFQYYEDAFDAPYIGPELSRDPSQAISTISDEKAVAVIRAVLDREPTLEEKFKEIFSQDFMVRVLGAVKRLIPAMVCYGENIDVAVKEQLDERHEENNRLIYLSGIMPKVDGYNRIIFGAPGTGKSHTLEGDRKELLYGGREVDEKELDLSQYGSYERVTFHPDYSYANFVGTYKPVPKGDEIAYEYVPGPFMRILVKALKSAMTDTPKPYVLLIEEINRANTAAVFGDVFQLLDRKGNISEYPIQTSEDMRKYLAKELKVSENECAEIRIPDNMFIWATMNSADQGVYPMDTAFKRRWDFTYIGIDEEEKYIPDRVFTWKGKAVKWNDIRKAINKVLEKEYGLNEDKLLGPFFISRNVLENADDELFWRTFDNKVLMYLCDDALRHRNGEHLFEDMKTEKLSYAKVHRMFQEKGLGIFNKKILEESNVQTVNDSFAENTNEA